MEGRVLPVTSSPAQPMGTYHTSLWKYRSLELQRGSASSPCSHTFCDMGTESQGGLLTQEYEQWAELK